MGNLCSGCFDEPREEAGTRPYHRSVSQQTTPSNSSHVQPMPWNSVSRGTSPDLHGNPRTFRVLRPYSPVVSEAPSNREIEKEIPRPGVVETKIKQVLPVVRVTPPSSRRGTPPPVQHEPIKLFIVGDSMTFPKENAFHVSCVDNLNAKWRKVQASTKIANELEILRSLNHPNVIRVLFTFSVNDVQHIAYEPVKNSLGVSVRSLHNYKDVVYQLADAVEYLQARRIVHLSLIPENIFVIEDNRKQFIKIGSFDFAFRMASHLASVAVGAPKHPTYSAPEIYDGTGVCLASDMFSLGQVIFFVFSKGGYLTNTFSVPNIVAQRDEDSESAEILCADLIFKLLMNNANDRLKGDQIKKHPFFWDADKTVNFIIEVNKLIEAGDANFRKCLYFRSTYVLGGNEDWSVLIEDAVLEELNDSRKEFIKRTGFRDNSGGKKNIINLVQVMRHVTVHSQKSSLIQGLMGSNKDFLEFWLERFPYLIRHMYNAKLNFEKGNFEGDEPHRRRTMSAKSRDR